MSQRSGDEGGGAQRRAQRADMQAEHVGPAGWAAPSTSVRPVDWRCTKLSNQRSPWLRPSRVPSRPHALPAGWLQGPGEQQSGHPGPAAGVLPLPPAHIPARQAPRGGPVRGSGHPGGTPAQGAGEVPAPLACSPQCRRLCEQLPPLSPASAGCCSCSPCPGGWVVGRSCLPVRWWEAVQCFICQDSRSPFGPARALQLLQKTSKGGYFLKAEMAVVHPLEAGLAVPWLPPDAYADRQCVLEVRAGPAPASRCHPLKSCTRRSGSEACRPRCLLSSDHARPGSLDSTSDCCPPCPLLAHATAAFLLPARQVWAVPAAPAEGEARGGRAGVCGVWPGHAQG